MRGASYAEGPRGQSTRLQAKQTALRAVGQHIQQTVRTLAHIANTLTTFKQLVLPDHFALERLAQFDPVQVAELQRPHKQIALPGFSVLVAAQKNHA